MDNNGYSGIVVAFDELIKPENRPRLLRLTKELFVAASNHLFEATNKRAFFEKIHFLVPKHWKISEPFDMYKQTHFQTINNADFVVTAEDTIWNNEPLTMQYGLCRQPGARILIPNKFILDDNYGSNEIKGKKLIQEWTRYRYGVFEEYGYTEDKMYPSYYSIPGSSQVKITSCAAAINKQLIDIETENINELNEKCYLETRNSDGFPRLPSLSDDYKVCHPSPALKNSSINVRAVSSLMYESRLEKVTEFCDVNSHNKEAPNRHNIFCNQISVWDIINKHKDFNRNIAERGTIPAVKFVKLDNSEPPVIIVVDVTKNRSLDLGSVIRRYRDDVSDVKIFEFVSPSNTIRTEGTFAGHDYFDGIYIQPALQNILSSINDDEIQMIIITEGKIKDDVSDLNKLAALLLSKYVSLKVIIYPFESRNEETIQLNDFIAKVAGEVVSIVEKLETNSEYRQTLRIDTAVELYKALKCFTISDADNSIILKEQIFTASDTIDFNFTVDNSVVDSESNLFVFLLVSDKSNFQKYIASLVLQKESRKFIYSSFIDERFQIKAADIEPGLWHLRSTVDASQTYVALAAVAPKQSNELVSLKCWLNTESRVIDSTEIDSLIVYAYVANGFYEYIENATVTLSVFDVSGYLVQENTMFDDGFGQPDITKGDGIYSAFITGAQRVNYYKIIVTVSSHAGTVKNSVIEKSNTKNDKLFKDRCCGSFIKAVTTNVDYISRQKVCAYFYLKNTFANKTLFGAVKSLKAAKVDPNSRSLDFVFYGPLGSISFYEFRYFTEDQFEYITASEFSKNADLNFNYWVWNNTNATGRPIVEYGQKVDITFKFPYAEAGIYYFAIKMTGNDGSESSISNIVKFRMNSLTASTEGNMFTSSAFTRITLKPPKFNETDVGLLHQASHFESWHVALIAMASLLLLAVIVSLLICCILWMRTKNQDEENATTIAREFVANNFKEAEPEKSNDNHGFAMNSEISPVQSWPAEVLLNHFSEVQHAKARRVPPPIMTLESIPDNSSFSNRSSLRNERTPNWQPNTKAKNYTDDDLSSIVSDDSSSYVDDGYGVRVRRAVTQV